MWLLWVFATLFSKKMFFLRHTCQAVIAYNGSFNQSFLLYYKILFVQVLKVALPPMVKVCIDVIPIYFHLLSVRLSFSQHVARFGGGIRVHDGSGGRLCPGPHCGTSVTRLHLLLLLLLLLPETRGRPRTEVVPEYQHDQHGAQTDPSRHRPVPYPQLKPFQLFLVFVHVREATAQLPELQPGEPAERTRGLPAGVQSRQFV